MAVSQQRRGGYRTSTTARWMRAAGLTATVLAALLAAPAHAEDAAQRLFIKIWWDSPAIEMDPSDDPGRIEVYIGESFVGCATAPSHLNVRRQLMVVPPSLGFTATGAASAVRVVVSGELAALPGRQVSIKPIGDDPSRPPS